MKVSKAQHKRLLEHGIVQFEFNDKSLFYGHMPEFGLRCHGQLLHETIRRAEAVDTLNRHAFVRLVWVTETNDIRIRSFYGDGGVDYRISLDDFVKYVLSPLDDMQWSTKMKGRPIR